MGYKKPTNTTRAYLENAPLPNHGKSYTVISHKTVIDNTLDLLKNSGFKVLEEKYRANMNANVAQGVYYIQPTSTDQQINDEKELGMMFTWVNSYDKSTMFNCTIGAYVKVCSNGMCAGDMYHYKRKHTGAADTDVRNHISSQIKNAEKYYKRLISDKETMKQIDLSTKQMSELTGRLFIDEDMIDSQQVTCIKKEIDKPSFKYKGGTGTAWAYYNHVTHALKKAHPRDWMVDQKNFHDFITAEILNLSTVKPYEEWILNFDNEDLGITNADTEHGIDIEVETFEPVEVDTEINYNRLLQDVYMGR